MKLNQRQRYALLDWLSRNIENFVDMQIIYDFDKFCDGDIKEWRVISTFGMSGKLWNNCDRVYISGHAPSEIGGFESNTYKKERELLDGWNAEIAEAIGIYADVFDDIVMGEDA